MVCRFKAVIKMVKIDRHTFRTEITRGSLVIGINLGLDGKTIDLDLEHSDNHYGIYFDENEWSLINKEIRKLKDDHCKRS